MLFKGIHVLGIVLSCLNSVLLFHICGPVSPLPLLAGETIWPQREHVASVAAPLSPEGQMPCPPACVTQPPILKSHGQGMAQVTHTHGGGWGSSRRPVPFCAVFTPREATRACSSVRHFAQPLSVDAPQRLYQDEDLQISLSGMW